MNLVQRATQMITSPATEWDTIATETHTPASLYPGYIIPLAVIGPIAGLAAGFMMRLGFSVFGLELPLFALIVQAVLQFAGSLLAVFILAMIASALAPSFGGESNQQQAFKLVTFSNTPAWVAGLARFIPFLGGMIAIAGGIYSLYVLSLGAPKLMKIAQDKLVGYVVALIVCAIGIYAVMMFVISMAVGMFGFFSFVGHGASGMMHDSANVADQLNDMNRKMEAAAKRMDEANKKMEAAQASGDQQAVVAAAGDAMKAAAGTPDNVQVIDPAKLKALLPETMNGLPRLSIESTKTDLGGFQVAKAHADYSDKGSPNKSLAIEITDTAGSQSLATLASLASIETDTDNEQGHTHNGKINGRPTHTFTSKDKTRTDIETLVAGRFMVGVHGGNLSPSDVEAIGNSLFTALDALKNEGVK